MNTTITDHTGDRVTVDPDGMTVRSVHQEGDTTHYLVEWYDEYMVEHVLGRLIESSDRQPSYEVRAADTYMDPGTRIGDAGSLTSALAALAQHHNA